MNYSFSELFEGKAQLSNKKKMAERNILICEHLYDLARLSEDISEIQRAQKNLLEARAMYARA